MAMAMTMATEARGRYVPRRLLFGYLSKRRFAQLAQRRVAREINAKLGSLEHSTDTQKRAFTRIDTSMTEESETSHH